MESVCYRCGAFYVDASNRSFKHGETEIGLEPKVLETVLRLLARPAALITRNELLDAVWGHRYVTPSTLNRVIALARRAFGDDADNPHFIQTVRGAGYRYIGPVEQVSARSPPMGAQFSPPPSARLPARIEELIGRETELDELAQMLERHRAVTVLGPGGVGKTSCALEAARRSADSYPDGVWFFDLAALRHAGEWLHALGIALSIQAPDEGELISKVCSFLGGRRALLVLDNCDQIAVGTGTIALAILRGTDRITLLCTSRQPLSVVGEQLMRMPPLALPAPEATEGDGDIAAVAAAPACALLRARARAVRPGFEITAANMAAIVDICRCLDGLPLALELAAARFALLSPEQILARLAERFRFLSSDVSGRSERHHDLVALLDWSYGLLSPAEQRMLTWHGVFVRGWTLEATVFVAQESGHDPDAAVDLLNGLVNKSLVAVDESSTPHRYRLLETIREFALVRLRASNAENDARAAHLAYVQALSREIGRSILAGRMRESIANAFQEDGNIEGALEYACQAGAGEAAMAIAGALVVYLKARGHYVTGRRWCDLALRDGANRSESFDAGRVLLSKGVLSVYKTKMHAATESLLSEAARVARINGDRWGEAYAAGYCALSLANAGDTEGAAVSAEVAGRIAEELDDPLLRGLAGLGRGWTEYGRGHYREAIDTLLSVRDLGPDFHQHHFIGVYIGLLHYELREWRWAAEQWLDGLHNAAYFRNTRGMAASVEGAGYLALQRGEPVTTAQMLGAAERIRDRTGSPLFKVWADAHGRVEQAARLALGETYDVHRTAGEGMREEDAFGNAEALLRSFVMGSTIDACVGIPPAHAPSGSRPAPGL